MTATLGSALIASARVHVERYAIGHGDIAVVDDTVIPPGTSAPLTIGTLSLVGGVVSSGDFGGQARHHWGAGVVGTSGTDGNGNPIGVQGWTVALPARPYHNDGGIMLSNALADLELDAATAVGASPFGTFLEVTDVRLDVAGSWLRPSAIGRDLLDALAVAAGQPRGAWWVAADGSTHLGPRPASAVTLSDGTVDPFDPALLRAVVRSASDNIGGLLPGATLTAPGLPNPLPVGALIVHVDGEDISAELWGEASHAELLARWVRHVMAPTVDYLPARPYSVASVAEDGRVAVSAPPGSKAPDAPLLGHAPGVPGASFTLVAPGASVLVSCVGGSPGAPVCVAYPPSISPASLAFDVSTSPTYVSPWPVPPSGKITFGGAAPLPLLVAVDASWFAQVMTALGQIKTAGSSGSLPLLLAALAALSLPTSPNPTVADKAQASHV